MENFDAGNIISLILGLLMAIPGILSWVILRKKAPSEIHATDATAVKTYAEAASTTAQRSEQLEKMNQEKDARIDKMGDRIDQLERDLDGLTDRLTKAIIEREEYIEYLIDGLGCNISEMEKAGVTPVWKPEKPRFRFHIENGTIVNGKSQRPK